MKYRVGIPTTNGVVVIQSLDLLEALPRSQVLSKNDFRQQAISSDYNEFTDNLLPLMGLEGRYRLVLDGVIESGRSWELPVALAHLLHAKGRLAAGEDGAPLLLATGALKPDLLVIRDQYHVEKKLDQLGDWSSLGLERFFVPAWELESLSQADVPLMGVSSLAEIRELMGENDTSPRIEPSKRSGYQSVGICLKWLIRRLALVLFPVGLFSAWYLYLREEIYNPGQLYWAYLESADDCYLWSIEEHEAELREAYLLIPNLELCGLEVRLDHGVTASLIIRDNTLAALGVSALFRREISHVEQLRPITRIPLSRNADLFPSDISLKIIKQGPLVLELINN